MKKSRADLVQQQASWPPQPQPAMPLQTQTPSPFTNTPSWYSAQHQYGQPDMSRRNETMDPYRQYAPAPHAQQGPTQQHHQQHPGAIQPPMTVQQQHTQQQQQQHQQQHAQHGQHVQQQHAPQTTPSQPQAQPQPQPPQQSTPTQAHAPAPRSRKRAAPQQQQSAAAVPAVTVPPTATQTPAQQPQATPIPPPVPPVSAVAPAAQPGPNDDVQSTPQPPPAKKSRTNTPWTPAEELRLKQMRDAGSSWAEIAKTFPTRTEGSVKKHWYKDMHYAEFAEDESQALLNAIKEYENNKWKTIGQKVGKPAKACEQYAKEHFPDIFGTPAKQR